MTTHWRCCGRTPGLKQEDGKRGKVSKRKHRTPEVCRFHGRREACLGGGWEGVRQTRTVVTSCLWRERKRLSKRLVCEPFPKVILYGRQSFQRSPSS